MPPESRNAVKRKSMFFLGVVNPNSNNKSSSTGDIDSCNPAANISIKSFRVMTNSSQLQLINTPSPPSTLPALTNNVNNNKKGHHHYQRKMKLCRRYHQVPTVKKTATTTRLTIQTRATTTTTKMPTTEPMSTHRLVLTSVIFLILMLAQKWHPISYHTSSLVVEASVSPSDASSLTTTTATTNNIANSSSLLISTTSNQQLKQRQKQPPQATFTTPNQAINITHVTYDPLHDTVYLGATNTIYQLNGSDLSVQYEQSTGPVYDNPSCGITECHGFEDSMKLTQDINKVLVIDYQHKKLLSCGSTKQGACRRYQLDNIAQREDLIPMPVAANDDNSTTYAFVAPARYSYDPAVAASGAVPASSLTGAGNAGAQQQQQVLYVASTYTKVGQSRELLVPAIGTRILDEGPNLLKLNENSFVDSRIDINSHLRDYFLVNYMYGFASSNHIYFVTVQKKATTRDFEELGYHTRLARICITDSSYNSYTEVDLKCVPNKRKSSSGQQHQPKHANYFTGQQQQQQQHSEQQPNDYPLLQDAVLVDGGSQLLQSLAQSDQLPSNFFSAGGSSPDDNKVLLGVFSSAKDHTQYAGDHSALCAFSLAQIEDKFNDNINSCYTGKMQSRNMEYIAGNVQECPKSGQGGNVVNFCHETLKINGTIPIVSEAAIQYYNTTLTAITATSYVNTQVKNIYSEQLSSELTNEQAKRDSTYSTTLNTAAPNKNNGPRQHTVVFAGTSHGHIKKILLNNASNGIEFEDVQLDTHPILSDLHLHSSGNQLIAATPYKVFKVPTHNCAQYASCRECSQSKNPYCGWCLLKRSCTTKSECGPISQHSSAAFDQRSNSISSGLHLETTSGGSPLGGGKQQQQQQPQPKWISADSSGKCIDLQSISPDKIPMTSTGKVDLYIDRLPRLPREHSYRCVFNRSEQTTATTTPFGLSCPLPKLMDRQRHIQIEPGRDHAIVELAVRSSETNTDFLDGKITFFDCQRHTTCKDCLTTNWGCNWCLNENVCLFNTSKCEKTTVGGQQSQQILNQRQDNSLVQLLGGGSSSQRSRQQSSSGSIVVGSSASGPQRGSTIISSGVSGSRTSNTISLVQQCPTFDVGHQQDILIADGSERELSIRVKNMPQFKGAMKCIVEIENYEISLKAQVQEDRVICANSTYSYAADVGLLNAQLKVIYSDSNIFIDRTNFTMYKCHLLGAYLNRPDCSLCQRIDTRFGCAWCSGSCQHRARCLERPDETCPPPRIDFVHPLSGPIQGGTRVTIEGSNLGQSFDEIAGRVSIGNVPCRPIEEEYRPSNRIVCLTSSPVLAGGRGGHHVIPSGADPIPGDISVGNRAGYTVASNQKFLFKSIYLRDHQPRYGPQSGGTRLALAGMNLNIGSSVQVFLDELPCLVEMSSLTSEQLFCRTTSSRQASRPIRHLKLIIDDAQIVRDDDVFYYTSDPIITKISPLRAYLSGGRPINVLGANLTVVQAPRMAIYDLITGKKVNESLCILQDDTRMQCPAPAVNLQMMDLEYAEQQTGAGLSSYEPNSQQPATASSAAWLTQTSRTNSFSQQQQQQQMFQQDESIRFKLGFIMDNVVQTSFPQLQTEIAYTSDPKLFPFASTQYRTLQEAELISAAAAAAAAASTTTEQTSTTTGHNYQVELDTFLLQPNEPTLTLHGEHLRAAVSEYEITVTVGQDQCNLTQLSQTRLVCVVPLDHMVSATDEDGHATQRGLPLVVVRIGFNLRYELGFVQYHPLLAAQIEAYMANQSLLMGGNGLTPSQRLGDTIRKPGYIPDEHKTTLNRITSALVSMLMVVGYVLLAILIMCLVYSATFQGLRLKERAMRARAYKHQLARFESLERSLKNDCRVASLALQGDLNELVRHIELSGVPLLTMKQYIMKVFFPGINNHPLLLRSGGPSASASATMLMVEQQQHHHSIHHNQAPLLTSPSGALNPELPMENFERLLLTKPFLVSFINTLERQPSFTIRDKVNVASLLMIVLMERLDYATDIMKTLLFQLVERSVSQLNSDGSDASGRASCEAELPDEADYEDASMMSKTTRRLTRRASNLLSGLPISKRNTPTRIAASQLGKVMNGSASSLMASTSVAAQMLLARVGHKTSPLGDENTAHIYQQQQQQQQLPANNLVGGPLDCYPIGGSCPGSEYMSTTTFNNLNGPQYQRSTNGARRPASQALAGDSCRSSLSRRNRNRQSTNASASRLRCKRQAQLMLRRTDSIVEKMLTNWLALNMHDHLHGPIGQSLYLLFEALRCQLERGPIDAISGDAYYSLSEHKLLREPSIQFEVVNLYVIVETDILHSNNQQQQANLLLDSGCPQQQLTDSAHLYDHHNQQQQANRSARFNTTNNRGSQQSYSPPGNTITLALRVLDCDTISQVKGKILSALYKNLPQSCRLGPNDVELSLRRHQPLSGHQTLSTNHHQQKQQQQQYVTVALQDEDFGSINSYNNNSGSRRINTLRHYGVVDQGIMLMKRANQSATLHQTTTTIDDHYSSPYAEIQYGHCLASSQQQMTGSNRSGAGGAGQRPQPAASASHVRSWHLIRASETDRTSAQLSEHSNDSTSSPSQSHSPSMMLLGGGASASNGQHQNTSSARPNVSNTLLQQFYHPSSSSTSSTGNVMDTHSTSANSSSMMNVNNMMITNRQQKQQQPQQQHSLANGRPHLMMGVGQQEQLQQPIYCQIGSISNQSQHGGGGGNCNATSGSQYYCQINAGGQIAQQQQPNSSGNHQLGSYFGSVPSSSLNAGSNGARSEQENGVYLARMLTSKGTIQKYIDNFFETILTARASQTSSTMGHGMQLYEDMTPVVFADHGGHQIATNGRRKPSHHQFTGGQPANSGACPPAVKWIFDLLDEAALKNGISDQSVIHAWKSNAFLLRFWVNFIKNPDYFLDVDKSRTLDASLSVIAQTLMDSCAPSEEQKSHPVEEGDYNKLIFSRELPKYRDMVKHFYQDIASMRPVSDQEMIEQMSFLSMSSTNEGGKFDTSLALKELCVYAVNYGVEIMNTLNADYACQQLELSQQLEQCFRSFTIFEAYR